MRKQLSKSEIKEIIGRIKKEFCLDNLISKKDSVVIDDDKIVVNGQIYFFEKDSRLMPHLKLLQNNNFLKKVVIDMNAVKFMASGADVMRPGIKEMDDFSKGEIISVVDEINKKPIAIGIALLGSDEIKIMDKGKVIKNIHYVGDEFW